VATVAKSKPAHNAPAEPAAMLSAADRFEAALAARAKAERQVRTIGTQWDVPPDAEEREAALEEADRTLAEASRRLIEEREEEVTELRLRVNDLEQENIRLRRARDVRGRAIATETNAYANFAHEMLGQGYDREEVLKLLTGVYRRAGVKRPDKSAKRVLEIAEVE